MKTTALLSLLATVAGFGPAQTTAQEPTVQNVRLTFHVIEADGFEGVDPAIEDIVAELREIFRFDGYRLLDTSVLRGTLASETQGGGRQGPAVVRQRMALEEHGTFEIEAFLYRASDPAAVRVSVRLRDEDAAYFSASGQRLMPSVIDASVTARSGQTVVLGSGRPDSSAGVMILAMSVQLDDQN